MIFDSAAQERSDLESCMVAAGSPPSKLQETGESMVLPSLIHNQVKFIK